MKGREISVHAICTRYIYLFFCVSRKYKVLLDLHSYVAIFDLLFSEVFFFKLNVQINKINKCSNKLRVSKFINFYIRLRDFDGAE